MANTTFTYTMDDSTDYEPILAWDNNKLDIFEKLEVEGFDDDGICELWYDFIDWEDGEEVKEFNFDNAVAALKEWGIVEELGLQEYENEPSLWQALYEMMSQEWNSRKEEEERMSKY